jgi:hypothetical protein
MRFGPKLADVCPEFRAKMEEYLRLADTDPVAAEKAFREAQVAASRYHQEQAMAAQ